MNPLLHSDEVQLLLDGTGVSLPVNRLKMQPSAIILTSIQILVAIAIAGMVLELIEIMSYEKIFDFNPCNTWRVCM
ncbi:hypothetical protein [Dyadobacter chenhuakuii]|uniref:Uncharacterized protein n=1 Tax=Dyadobacter chenhuakuii TaxID=2909339 RepID=A0ABY4XQ44_9BACT|nr:hypothetical protein [Dyadobacter chenhuakuii]MCF2493449.1 hypothetical protein [Dyadobacter chenhuakuii]USJ32274.1 hypothetical protein NFI80_05925 [Dyadobacter chenhuakuii]